jgi:hypothetical protein
MGRPVSARGKADEKPDENSYKRDPLYLWLRAEVRRGRRAARKHFENARRRRRWATDQDFRDKHRARRYGLTLQDYRAILERQGNACGICKAPAKPLCVDHCHASGKVRGFLCRGCNLGLGNYHDDPARMRAAAAYLEAARNPAPAGGVLGRCESGVWSGVRTGGPPLEGRSCPSPSVQDDGGSAGSPAPGPV